MRVFEQAVGQVADFVAESGGEQQALLFFGNQRQHFFHVMDKAHVQHAVGLVEHQNLHLAQIQHALLLQVQQTPWRGYQNVYAFFEFADLRAHAHTAKNHGAGELQVFTVGADGFFHLRGEFAGGGEHQRADAGATEFVLGAAAHGQAVQQRQGECGCFARAGLRATEEVAAFQNQRNGLRLDRGGNVVALLAHSF